MKKIITAILALTMAVTTLTACSNNNSNSENKESKSTISSSTDKNDSKDTTSSTTESKTDVVETGSFPDRPTVKIDMGGGKYFEYSGESMTELKAQVEEITGETIDMTKTTGSYKHLRVEFETENGGVMLVNFGTVNNTVGIRTAEDGEKIHFEVEGITERTSSQEFQDMGAKWDEEKDLYCLISENFDKENPNTKGAEFTNGQWNNKLINYCAVVYSGVEK